MRRKKIRNCNINLMWMHLRNYLKMQNEKHTTKKMAKDNNNCQPNCPCGQYYKEAIEDIRIILDAYISQQEGLDSPELIIGKALDYIKRLTSPERKPPWE